MVVPLPFQNHNNSAIRPTHLRLLMLPIRIIILVLACWLPAAFGFAAESYLNGQLNNGLHYHILPTTSGGKQLSVQLQINAGTSDEDPHETGMAHMVEHMVFQSSPAYPNGISKTLTQNQWQIGRHFNALTTYNFTRYMLTPPRGNSELEDSIKVAAEILRPRQFKAQDWAGEQQIILGEWRSQQNLQERLAQKLNAPLLAGSRQVRHPPIGTEQAIRNATSAQLSTFHNKWFIPNNAQILVTGDINSEKTLRLIKRYFDSLTAQSQPTHPPHEYEPQLGSDWHTAIVQDQHNTDSSLDLIFRFPNTTSRGDSDASEYQRLLDNFAAYIINRHLTTLSLPPDVLKLELRSSNLGRQTGSIGFYAQTTPSGHRVALHTLLKARKDILANSIDQQAVADYRKQFSENLRNNTSNDTLPATIQEAIRQAQDSIFQGSVWRNSATQSARVRRQLYRISSEAIERRIQEWLNTPDKLVRARAPALNAVQLPNSNQFEHFADAPLQATPTASASTKRNSKNQRSIANSNKKPKSTNTPEQPLLALNSSQATDSPFRSAPAGQITGSRYDAANKVEFITLSNGDRAVLLQQAVAGDRVYFSAIANTGYQQHNLSPWQAKLAADLVWQQAPQGIHASQWQNWRQQRGIKLNYQLENYRQNTQGEVAFNHLADFFQLYRAYQTQADIGDRWQERLATEAQRQTIFRRSPVGQQELMDELLRFGQLEYEDPNPNDILALNKNTLQQQWQLLSQSPVSYYIVSSQAPARIKPLLEQYLANIPRQNARNRQVIPSEGANSQRAAIGDAMRTDVHAWSWQPFYNWTPDTSEHIPLLVNLANARLKEALRQRAMGVYSLKFRSIPQPLLNRIENELVFNTEPARADELWRIAQQVLEKLPDTISKTEADNLRQLFIEQEAKRQQNPYVWLDRLAQSDQKYGDARYLSALPDLNYTIIQTRLRQTAKLLWASHNGRVLFSDPKR